MTDENKHRERDLVREVGLEFGDAAAPVGGRLLADQFDVEERSLSGSVEMTRRRSTHDTWRYVRHQVLYAPSIIAISYHVYHYSLHYSMQL